MTTPRLAAFGFSLAALTLSSSAEDPATQTLAPTVVLGTRIHEQPENTSSPVTVISREQLDARQLLFLADALRGESGLDVVRSGQPGGLTSVFLRGAPSAQTLVLVDGVRVNSAFNNAFDFSSLTLDNVEQIEVLRGPQSTLYGSEALGGVINIVTRSGADPVSGSTRFEYGTFDTWLARGSFALSEKQLSLSAEGGYAASDNERINSHYATPSASGRIAYRFSDHLSVNLRASYQHTEAGSPNDRFTDDPNDRLRTENHLLALAVDADPARWWNLKLTASHGYERASFDQPQPNPPWFLGDYGSVTRARRQSVDLQNILTPAEHHKVLAGLSFQRDEATFEDTFSAFEDDVDNVAGYAQYEFAPVERLTATVGGRVDDFSSFGTHATYRAGLRGTLPQLETILRANVGSGFRAPSIRELYWPVYGNPQLEPEESLGWDAGVEQPLFRDRMRIGATFFHNDFNDLINGFPPRNVATARTLGIESFVTVRLLTNLTARFSYTWLDARDQSDGSRLDRRPEHRGSADVQYAFLRGLSLNLHALLVGQRPDSDYSTFPTSRVTLPGYARLDAGLSWKVCKNFTLHGRIENLTDEDYEETYGFPALGRTFTIGATAQF